jgi:hypothetical protein
LAGEAALQSLGGRVDDSRIAEVGPGDLALAV